MSFASERIRRDPELMAPVRTTLSVGGVPHGNLHFTQGPPSQLSRRPSSAGSNVEETKVNLEFVRKEAELIELELELENQRAKLKIKRDILTAEKELKIQEVLENSENFKDHDIQLEEEKRNRTETFVRQSVPNSTCNQETLKETLQFSNFLL
ncbi:hypothetical protein DPMN_009804 [Dreissena polymorpha]|uniref:Uncharacterized protein n=1 Tax=Dreissena polymorpha TaxID=45954 RepID=A0A9D4N134_DREPO|nr:hypothetical protein DPMN_009804 [Dreissena polymorpha]